MIKQIQRVVFIILAGCLSLSVYSQDIGDLSSTDLSQINIDALSDEQVQKFLDRAEESGLTLDQLELAAKQRGMSSSQIAKLRNRIRQLQSGIEDQDPALVDPSNRLRETYDDEEDEYQFFSFLSDPDSIKSGRLEIFGLDIFRSADLTFEPSLNVATPENYILGAGDEIIIDVFGASEITYQETISPDGNILVSGVGPISLVGISVKEARNRIFNRLSSIYSGIRGRNPNTFIQVSVGQVRSIKVNVVGNVVQPGTYTLSSFSSAFNALYFAGGPTETGSMRHIEVVRNGKKVATLDIYKYLFEGDDSQNPQLLDQDAVVIKPYINRVKLTGNVKNPAIYELKDGETFQDLLSIAGGFTGNAYKESVTIDRIGVEKREVATIRRNTFENTAIQDGDSIYVEKVINQYSNRVKIEGAVKRPGYFELTDNLTLSDLVNLANGFREDVYKERGNIIRLNEDLTLKNLSFDIQALLNDQQDIVLSPNDVVIIPSIFDIEEKKILTLQGSINNPGVYPYIDGMTVEDLISVAGGLKEEASTSMVEVARKLTDNSDLSKSAEIFTFPISEDLGVSDEASEFQLAPFDVVLIKSSPFNQRQKVIRIEGEVMFPGYYALETNEDKISDLIKRAGGLTQYGYAKGASLIRRTEYFRTAYQKEELEALVEAKREELQERYADDNSPSDISKVELINRELEEYERELTENIKKSENSDELEARIFRAHQLRVLQLRDSISGASELVEQEGIGIELEKILESPGSVYDLILRDGDLLSIPRQLQTVKVQGEVLYPNSVRFERGSSFKRYVSSAGGFSDDAKPSKAYVVYANGVARQTRSFLWFKNYPPILPGADIVIPKKQNVRKLSPTEILGIASSLATIALIVDRLSN